MMIHSEELTEFVAGFEGFRSSVYKDQRGIPTIGFGHTQGVTLSTPPCTRNEALRWLDIDLHTADEAVERMVSIDLTQNEWDALVSLVFNIGQGNFAKSTLLIMLNANGSREAIAQQFLSTLR